MGKKFLLGLLQVISFLVIYESILWITTYLYAIIINVVKLIPIIGLYITETRAKETLLYTIIPLISSIIIVNLMKFIWKKTGVYLLSAILIFMIVSFCVISALLNIINNHGIVSWDTVNAIWYYVILCAIIFIGIFKMVTIKSEIGKITDDIEIN